MGVPSRLDSYRLVLVEGAYMIEHLVKKVVTCPVCHTTYLPDEGVCQCPDEPVVQDWEDHPFQPSKVDATE